MKRLDVDPFSCKPPPSKWLRIAFWTFLGVAIAALVLAKYWR